MDWTRKQIGSQIALLVAVLASGCHTFHSGKESAPVATVPRELDKVSLPDYRVEPPDILLIEAVRAVPKPPYKVEPLDVLFISVSPSLPDEPPLSGLSTVEPEGTVNLGISYGGAIKVAGMTVPEIKTLLEKHFRDVTKIKEPKVTVTLAQSRASQRVGGPHLIRPDGTISLGTYGTVRVAGLTLAEVREAVEVQLSAYLLDPEVSVDVGGFNSKLFYVIYDGAGVGQTVIRLPITGSDTVLDAIAQIYGLPAVSSQDRIWVSRPAPAGSAHQILPVDWRAVTECADTTTNYQLMPGDRVYVAAYPLVAADNRLARVIAPIERLFGITLLGTTVRRGFLNSSNGGTVP
jgi:polysaccharide export outer membrane protein